MLVIFVQHSKITRGGAITPSPQLCNVWTDNNIISNIHEMAEIFLYTCQIVRPKILVTTIFWKRKVSFDKHCSLETKLYINMSLYFERCIRSQNYILMVVHTVVELKSFFLVFHGQCFGRYYIFSCVAAIHIYIKNCNPFSPFFSTFKMFVIFFNCFYLIQFFHH